MSDAAKNSAALNKALDATRKNLVDALASLQAILSDPSTPNAEAIRANDLYKSLKRFASKL